MYAHRPEHYQKTLRYFNLRGAILGPTKLRERRLKQRPSIPILCLAIKCYVG